MSICLIIIANVSVYGIGELAVEKVIGDYRKPQGTVRISTEVGSDADRGNQLASTRTERIPAIPFLSPFLALTHLSCLFYTFHPSMTLSATPWGATEHDVGPSAGSWIARS